MYVNGLHSHGLQIPDVAAALSFYDDFGLVTSSSGDVGVCRCEGRNQEQVVLREGPVKQMQSVAFTINPGSGNELRQRLARAGYPETDGPGEGIWVRDPDGLLVRFIEGEPARPREYPHLTRNFDGEANRVDEARWLQVAVPKPRRLGHVIKFTADLAAAEHFYVDLVSLKLSDGIDGALQFWNHGLGGDHHVFGAIQSTHPGLHHASFEVADLDEIGMGSQQMAQRGHALQWGIGRHSFGSNLFNYVQDPWGSWIEYFSEMDVITCNWIGKFWETPPAVWGAQQPAEFLANGEARPSGAPAT